MKVFINDIPFTFAPSQNAGKPGREEATFANPSFSQIWKFYEMARDGQIQGQKGMRFLVSDYDKAVEEWKSKFTILHAAGGIVEKGEDILFIHRLGKWDLPKGKVEKGESIEEASVREVEEECGVKAQLGNKIGETWHTYQDRKGREILKCTHWFAMTCLSDRELSPQTEEDITEVAWVPSSEVDSKPLQNTYASIRDIYGRWAKELKR